MSLTETQRTVIAKLLLDVHGDKPHLVSWSLYPEEKDGMNRDEVLAMDERLFPNGDERYAEYNLRHLRAARTHSGIVRVYAVHSKTPVDRCNLRERFEQVYRCLNRDQIIDAVNHTLRGLVGDSDFIRKTREKLKEWSDALHREHDCGSSSFAPPCYEELRDLVRERLDAVRYPDDKEYGELAGKHIVPPLNIPNATHEP